MAKSVKLRILKQEDRTPFQDVTVGKVYDATRLEEGDPMPVDNPLLAALFGDVKLDKDDEGYSFVDDVGDRVDFLDERIAQGYAEVVTE